MTTSSPYGRIAEGYRIVGRIKRGPDATVYHAVRESDDAAVALKVFGKDAHLDGGLSHLKRLPQHPHIVRVQETGRTLDGRSFVAMDYHPDGSYADLLERSGPIPVDEAVEVGVAIAEALQATHDVHLVHRDVTPGNILRGANGPALTNFGISAVSRESPGTPPHAAPEALFSEPQDAPADINGLASTIWTLLAGQPPFAAPDAKVPVWLQATLRKAMAKAPGERYPSAAAFATALRESRLPSQPPSVAVSPVTESLAATASADPPSVLPNADLPPAATPISGTPFTVIPAAAIAVPGPPTRLPRVGALPMARPPVTPPLDSAPPMTHLPMPEPPIDSESTSRLLIPGPPAGAPPMTSEPAAIAPLTERPAEPTGEDLPAAMPPIAAPPTADPPVLYQPPVVEPDPGPADGTDVRWWIRDDRIPTAPATGDDLFYPVRPAPRSRSGRGLLIAAAIAVFVVLAGVAAFLLVPKVSSSRKIAAQSSTPSLPTTTAPPPAASQKAGSAPQHVQLADQQIAVKLTWKDPTGGNVPFYVVGKPTGGTLQDFGNVDRGKTSVLVNGLNPTVDYCFVVGAILSVDQVANSPEICTHRFGTASPNTSSASPSD